MPIVDTGPGDVRVVIEEPGNTTRYVLTFARMPLCRPLGLAEGSWLVTLSYGPSVQGSLWVDPSRHVNPMEVERCIAGTSRADAEVVAAIVSRTLDIPLGRL